MENYTIEDLMDSFSPYEIAVLAFSYTGIQENENLESKTVILKSKQSLIWGGAIAHALIYNTNWNVEKALSVFRESVRKVSNRNKDIILGRRIKISTYYDTGLPFIQAFLEEAGLGEDLELVIERTQDAIHNLELRGILIDPFLKKIKNTIITVGVVMLFPVHFVIDGPRNIDIRTIGFEYIQKGEGDHLKREFRVRVKEAAEAISEDLVPAFIRIAERFGPAQPSIKLEEVQEKLKNLGYYTGKIDGIAGPKTIDALRKFQQEKYLPVTGHIDAKTIKALM